MPKEFYTERDIEDMANRGVLSLRLTDDVVLTDLAYEAARRLGMNLLREKPENASAAAARPNPPQNSPQPDLPPSGTPPSAPVDGSMLRQRIHNAVIPRLGNQVDAQLLDVIITRVLHSTGIK